MEGDECGFDELSAMLNESDDEALLDEASAVATTSQQDDELNREQCGLDEVSAMLNCSHDEQLPEEESAMGATSKLEEGSSDDDIDDDELDRLAKLVEKGDYFTEPNLPQHSSTPPVIKQEPIEKSAQTETAMEKELREMKEKIRLLESRLQNSPAEKSKAVKAENRTCEVLSSSDVPKQQKETIVKNRSTTHLTDSPSRSGDCSKRGAPSSSTKPTIQKRDSSNDGTKYGHIGSSKSQTANRDSSKNTSIRNVDSGQTPTRNGHSTNSEAAGRCGNSRKSLNLSSNCSPNNKSRSGDSSKSRTPSRSVDSNNGTSGVNAGQKRTSTTSAVSLMRDLEVDLFGTDSESHTTSKVSTPLGSQNGKSSGSSSSSATKSSYKPSISTNATGTSADLCGMDDDDENVFDMDGDGGSFLSKEGKEYNVLLKVGTNRGERVAHAPAPTMASITNRKATWGAKAPPKRFDGGMAVPKAMKPEEYDPNVSVDPFSGIRLMNPLVSSIQMKARMENRTIVKLSTIHSKPKSSLEGDWVTIGVITYKTDPKTSQKGNAFSIWNLSDLKDCSHLVKLFLFGETHKAHWKTSVGGVVGILNPSLMQNNEKYQNKSDEVCITVDHPQKLMLMGTSKDLGYCKAKTKAGRNCTQFLNKKQEEYCMYHVQKKYKESSGKRSELQSGHSGVVPKSFEKKLFPKSNSQVFYGGQAYSTVQTTKEKKVSLKSLVQHGARAAPGKLTTLALHPILPEDADKLIAADKAKEAEKHKEFHTMLSTPTVGAINFVKHLAKKEFLPGGDIRTSGKVKAAPHLGAKDLLKQHQQDLEQRRLDHRRKQQEQERRRCSTGPMIDLDEPLDVSCSPPTNALQFMPKLGRGLSMIGKPLHDKNQNALLDKKKAVFLMQARGGIKKEDPNAVRKSATSETREAINKRLVASSDDKDSSSSGADEPPRKKSRLLGGVDLDDPEVKKLLKSKSKHAHELTEQEEEKQELYFSIREKKEAMEEQMAKIHKVETKAVTCKNCKYTAFSPLDTCKQQRHNLVWHKAFKRFFNCKGCKSRTTTIAMLPTRPCDSCGGSNWEKGSMMKEKKAVLPGAELLLRGEERKHVNS